jgi:glycosyltransferase involved in cell wall biosynthesis
MRILIITQWFDPEPALKGLSFAKALAARGHDVEVLTGFPNYPGGRLYPGYRLGLRQRASMSGIQVTRVFVYPSHDSSAIRRSVNYASFSLASTLIGLPSIARPDVVYVYHPPISAALPGVVLHVLRGVPFVLDVQDLWPDTLAATGMLSSRILLRIAGRACGVVYGAAAHIVVLSKGFKQSLVERGVPGTKIHVVYNWCREETPGTPDPDAPILNEARLDGRFNVVFAGTMGHAQELQTVLSAASIVARAAPHVQFIFVGGGVELPALKARAAQAALPNVRFLDARPPAEVAPLLAAADVLLVHLRDDPLFSITIPSKTQSYLAAGRPLLMAVDGDAAELVREAGAGVCIRPSDPEALARAVFELSALPPAALTGMGTSGRAFYADHLSLSAGVDRLERVLRQAAFPSGVSS